MNTKKNTDIKMSVAFELFMKPCTLTVDCKTLPS